jgi:putative endonuclease
LYSEIADKYYVGHTPDVFKRLNEHNNPEKNSKFTAKYLPWKLMLSFDVSDRRSEAIRVERFIKNQKSRSFILKLIAEKQNNIYFINLTDNILHKNG